MVDLAYKFQSIRFRLKNVPSSTCIRFYLEMVYISFSGAFPEKNQLKIKFLIKFIVRFSEHSSYKSKWRENPDVLKIFLICSWTRTHGDTDFIIIHRHIIQRAHDRARAHIHQCGRYLFESNLCAFNQHFTKLPIPNFFPNNFPWNRKWVAYIWLIIQCWTINITTWQRISIRI